MEDKIIMNQWPKGALHVIHVPWQFVAEAIELHFVFTGELLREVNHRMGELPRLWKSGGPRDAHWAGAFGIL